MFGGIRGVAKVGPGVGIGGVTSVSSYEGRERVSSGLQG